MKLLARLDEWWDRTAPDRRLDRNAGNMSVLIGLIFPSLAIVLWGPAPSTSLAGMPLGLQLAMCACIFTGCATKLHGALAHSRFYFPKMPVKTCYRIAFGGAPFASAGLIVYGYFLLLNTHTIVSSFGVVFYPILGMGIQIQALFYLLEARRIESNERRMIHEAKQVIREQRNTD